MRWSKRKTVLAIFFLAVAIAVVILSLVVPRSFINETSRQTLVTYLQRHLGSNAEVENVSVSWREVRFTGVSLPLSETGSHLEIEHATASIRPWRALISPTRLERALGAIECHHPRLFITADTLKAKPDTTTALLPDLFLPTGFYGALDRIDTLCSISFRNAEVFLISSQDTLSLLSDFDGEIFQNRAGSFHLRAQGRFLEQPKGTAQLSAAAKTKEKHFDAVAQVSFGGAQIASLFALPDSILFCGGNGLARLRLSAQDTLLQAEGDLDLTGLQADIPGFGSIDFARTQLDFFADTLRFSQLNIASHGCSVKADGQVCLRRGPAWDIQGEFCSLKGENFANLLLGNADLLSGELSVGFDVRGDLFDPKLHLRIESDEAQLGPLQLQDISSRISLSRSLVELEQFVAESDVGKLVATGSLSPQQSDFPISFEGYLSLNSGKPQGALRASNLRVRVRGTRKEPKTTIIVADSTNESILSGHIRKKLGKWQFVADGTGQVPRMDFAFVPEGISAKVMHAQRLWMALTYPTALHEHLPFLDVYADFEGGSLSGRFNLEATVDSTAEFPTALSFIRKAALRGSYVRPEQAPLVLLGGWEIAADKDLAGTFDLSVESDRIDVHEMRFADFATMTGVVWPEDSEVDLDLEIHGIPLAQFPIHIPILEKARIRGTIAGYVHACGTFDTPIWTADLSLVEGEALGVSDYWSTVELEGFGSRCDVRQFIFGRDIGRVFSATGHLDWEADSVELTASSGERVADEILQTLTGQGGWLDGLLNTRAVISGRLSDPTISAVLSVYQGHILRDISFDTLTAHVNWDFDNDGQRRIRIPRARMERVGRYSLQGFLETNPFPGGRFAGEITGEGEFLCILEELARSFRSHKGDGTLRARIGGTWDHPQFLGAELSLTDGKFTFTDITPNSVEMSLKMRLTPGGVLEYGQANFHSGSHQLTIRSLTDSVSTMAANLTPIQIKNPAVNLGVIEITSGENGMPLRFPGFMAPDWVGNFTFGSPEVRSVTLSWEEKHLVIQGDVALHNATITFPFLRGSGRPSRFARWLLNLLTQARWDLRLIPEEGNHYYAEFTGLKDSDLFTDWQDSPLWRNFAELVDRLDVDAQITPSRRGVLLEGRISEESFHGIGRLTSLRGNVDYLDQTFHIEEVVAEFDASDPRPVMRGRAETTGQDTLGRQVPVYLTLYVIDRETGIRAREGRLDELTVVLEGEYESTPEQVLALLGYSVEDMGGQAWRVGGAIMERALRARVLRPFERRIERWTGLDVLSVAPTLQSRYRSRRSGNTTPADTLEQSFGFRYFTGSQLTVGKFLTRDLFFSYTGELAEAEEVGLEGKRLGLVHFWTMEFRMRPISRDLVMDFSIEYDDLERKQDESVSLKYVFALEP